MKKGKIVQVMGPVVDVEFSTNQDLPAIRDALEVDNQGKRCVMEVAQHIGNNTVRCIMLAASEGLHRDMEVTATGDGIKVPVGNKTLGRLFNVLGEAIDGETINGIRAGLMGPLAGIGDSLIVGTLIPILLGIALGLSGNGSPLGAIFYIIVWNLLMFFGMKFAYFKGYEMGGKAVELLVGEQAQALRESIIMIGTMVIGAVAASWINIETSFEIPGIIELQSTFDSIYPKLLSGVTVIFCWWLMTKKKISPTVVMGILVVIAFVGVLLGFFDPNLSY